MIVDQGDAIAEFTRLVQPTVCPELVEEEWMLILDRHRRGYLWVVSTAIQLGTRVIPTLANRNGRHYQAVAYTTTATDQRTGATEPAWSTTRDSRVTDNHVIWEEAGWDWNGSLWDVTAAARDGWLLKMAKASPSSDFETDAMAVKSSQLFEHCKAMAATFESVYVL